jgi:Domain of unknown function (DUF4864)
MTHVAKSLVLLFLFSLCVAIIVTHNVRRAMPAPAPHELYSIVNSQLAALRASDFSRAYWNASSDVQQRFSLPQFERMVRSNYAAMTQTQRVEFGLVQVQGPSALVQVFFFASDGTAQAFLYNLVAEDGGWKIEGIERMEVPQPGQSIAGLRA